MKNLLFFLLLPVTILLFFIPALSLAQDEKSDLLYLKAQSAQAPLSNDKRPLAGPMLSIDGDLKTAWVGGLGLENQWISLDLGKTRAVSEIKIYWAKTYAIDYEVLVANEGGEWHQLILAQNRDGELDDLSFEPQGIRYIKILTLKPSQAKSRISVREIECYGPVQLNPTNF